MSDLEQHEIIQIVPDHKWGGCLAIVDEPKSFGCTAYVTAPVAGEIPVGRYYIRLEFKDFERIGAKANFILSDENTA